MKGEYLMQYGYVYSRLTAAQLREAAHDLRNAAMVIRHAGHGTGALVNTEDGTVCAVGAIEIATYKRYAKGTSWAGTEYEYHTWYANGIHAHIERGTYRAERAIVVMGAFVPEALCDECDDELHRLHNCDRQEMEPWERVTHWNDTHCRGGIRAENVLREAAAWAEEQADRKQQRTTRMLAAV